MIKCGLVGLPNVGKSTIFNILTFSNKAKEGNYPFCTINPSSSIVSIKDDRLLGISSLFPSAKVFPPVMEIIDIAGIIKNAHKGEGLGNEFLSHIKCVDVIIHVVRCFSNKEISHVHEKISPIFDIDVINTELLLADIQYLEKIANNKKDSLKDDAKVILEKLNKGEKASLLPPEITKNFNLL